MKNTNLKLNKTKLVARLMVVVILFSIMSLVSCYHHDDSCVVIEVRGEFESFKETQTFIQERIDKYGYDIIAFDLDNEPSVTNTNYQVLLETRSSYPNICAKFHMLKNEKEIMIYYIDFLSSYNLDDDTKFDIKLIEIKEYNDLSEDSIYQKSLKYHLYCNGQKIVDITVSVPLLEDGNYEEYYSDVCDMLLDNLVVIK